MITSNQERDYYDRQYSQYLALPAHALRIDRAVLEKNLDDPRHPFWERRHLYRGTMRALEPFRGLRVLDYGCGPADFGLWMATEGATVTLLDISPAAIELGLKRAAASNVTVRGVAADAASLPMFSDGEFELVFACASLHHTLKYTGAPEELARVMAPGARLVLCETWGGSALLNAIRRWDGLLTCPPEEQGEDVILSHKELEALQPWFEAIEVTHYNLLAMGKRLLRGRFEHAWARGIVYGLEAVDRALLLLPTLREWCGEALVTARRRAT